MKTVVTTILLALAVLANVSSRPVEAQGRKTEERMNLVVVPYPPMMYSNTGDYYLCKATKMNTAELNDIFRRSLESTLISGLANQFNPICISRYSSYGPDNTLDLELLYRSAQFSHTKRALVAYTTSGISFGPRRWLKSAQAKYGSNCLSARDSRPNPRNHLFSYINIKDPTQLSQVAERHDSKFFIFLNRLEIKTRYSNCMDMQSNVFQRDVFVHYNLVDSSGAILDGGVVGITFQNPTNVPAEIIDLSFGSVSSMIVDQVRRKLL